MTEARPEPLVPPEVDLRDFGFMPLDIRRLLTSETWIEAAGNPRLGHALMSLWAESWHQVPAGSLPKNEKVLQRLSMCPTPREWAKIRERVLLGWIECSDGLLYHPVVAEKAIESWEKKSAQRARTKAATEARSKTSRNRDEQRNEHRNVHQGTVQGTGKGEGRNVLPSGAASGTESPAKTPAEKPLAAPADKKPEAPKPVTEGPAFDVAERMREQGVEIEASDPRIGKWIDAGITFELIDEAIAKARTPKRKPVGPIPGAYLATIVDEMLGSRGIVDEGRADPQCVEIVDGERCRNAATSYPGRSKKGNCREHAE